MAYVILVNEDNTLYGSNKERIMQRSKLVDKLVFIVPSVYHGIDMTNASVMMEYILPVSREYKTVLLSLSEERYKDCFLQYKLPFDVDLTSQAGSLELQLTFAYTELNENGIGIQRVRKTSTTTIEIIPISAWSDIVPDSALSALDQRLIKLDAQMRGLNDYLDVLDNSKVDNLVYDDKNETLQLYANGIGVGDKVSVRDMLDDGIPVVDLDSNSGNNSDNNSGDDTGKDNEDNKHDCDCNHSCDCEDNVVEFGYDDSFAESTDDEDNVVEF